MNRAGAVRARNALRNALKSVQETGFASAHLEQVLEYQIQKAEDAITGTERRHQWSGKFYRPDDTPPEPSVFVTPEGDVVVGSTSTREQEAYDQAVRIMTTAMRAMAREMRRSYSYHEVRYAIKGAAVFLSRDAPRLVSEATRDPVPVVPRQEDERKLPQFSSIGDEQPEPPALERPNGRRENGNRKAPAIRS